MAIREQLLPIILSRLDKTLAGAKLGWQTTAADITVPGHVVMSPKPGDIGGGIAIAMPSSRVKGEWQVSIVSADVVLGEARAFRHVEFEAKEGAEAYLQNVHRKEVQHAVTANKPVPRNVLEEYKGEPWADAALAKQPTPTTLEGEIQPSVGAAAVGFTSQDPALESARKQSLKTGQK